MDNRQRDLQSQGPGQQTGKERLLQSMDAAGEAIIRFAQNRSVPQWLTALGGMLIFVGAMTPWIYSTYYRHAIEGRIGFAWMPGKIVAGLGLVIVLMALFIRTKPGKPNSVASSGPGLALAGLLIACYASQLLFPVCCVDYLPGYGTAMGPGPLLSLFGAVFTFICGLIPNPRQADTNKESAGKFALAGIFALLLFVPVIFWAFPPYDSVAAIDAARATSRAQNAAATATYAASVVDLHELASHPDRYQGKWVVVTGPIFSLYSQTEFLLGTWTENVAVVRPGSPGSNGSPSMVTVEGVVGGDCEAHPGGVEGYGGGTEQAYQTSVPPKTFICAERIR